MLGDAFLHQLPHAFGTVMDTIILSLFMSASFHELTLKPSHFVCFYILLLFSLFFTIVDFSSVPRDIF